MSTHPCGQTLVKGTVKPYLVPYVFERPPELLPHSSNFIQTLQILPIQKLSIFSRDTTFMLGGISNFKWKRVKNLVNCSFHYSSAPWKTSNFACSLCSNHWVKHRTTFIKVVEGSLIYKFAFYHLVHFSSNFGRKTRSTRAKPNWANACRAATLWPCSRARPRAPRRTPPYARVEAGLWSLVCVPHPRPCHVLGPYSPPDRTPFSLPVHPRSLPSVHTDARPPYRGVNARPSFVAKAGSRPAIKAIVSLSSRVPELVPAWAQQRRRPPWPPWHPPPTDSLLRLIPAASKHLNTSPSPCWSQPRRPISLPGRVLTETTVPAAVGA
jgi:hypothetical protein